VALRFKKKMKDAWVKALRSGEYVQGQGRLRKGDDFFCLGVACDLFIDGWWEDFGGDSYEIRGACALPPLYLHAAMEESGLLAGRLAVANDEGALFDDIADTIERMWAETHP
jgi:hypothetical protein